MHKPVRKVIAALRVRGDRLVLAESCTGGLLAASFTEVPGVSENFCGSFVVYREGAKHAWLGVSAKLLARHTAVSAEVAEAMVRGTLKRTPEATVAGAITGYLGPDGEEVGLVYYSVMRRGSPAVTRKLVLQTVRGRSVGARLRRRELAAISLLTALAQLLSSNRETGKRAKF